MVLTLRSLSLAVSVEGFQQPFEINVELEGVVHDATEVQINQIRQKSRKLHCVTVSLTDHSLFSPPLEYLLDICHNNHTCIQRCPELEIVDY